MSIKKRIQNIEKQAKNEADGLVIFDENDPKDAYIKGVCQRTGISPDSKIVGIWRRFLIPKARDTKARGSTTPA